jgi:hypothetical protein
MILVILFSILNGFLWVLFIYWMFFFLSFIRCVVAHA